MTINIIRVSGIRLSLSENEDNLNKKAALGLGIKTDDIISWSIHKKSLDARKSHIDFTYILDLTIKDNLNIKIKGRDITIAAKPISIPYTPKWGINSLSKPPLVIGAGPAGIFAALYLAKYGYRPLLIDQGKDVDQRAKDVNRFWQEGILDKDSNVQFGEGGAGAFSDGKLTSRSKDPLSKIVFLDLVEAGADPEILFWHKPHIGSDLLIKIIKNLRQKIIELGGNISYSTKIEDLCWQESKLYAAKINKYGKLFPLDIAILAPGHSARDTYAMLYKQGVTIVPKPFAIGLRIEHDQNYIDSQQYGKYAGHPNLGAADYRLTWKDEINSRGVYTFCMCPGGYIVNATSEAGGVVTNGMSNAKRDSGKANSAVVVTVGPGDFGNGALDGIAFQRHWEKLAYDAGGSNYSLPCQLVEDFLNDRLGEIRVGDFHPLTKGIKPAYLKTCLPDCVTDSIKKALVEWQRQMNDFIKSPAVLAGVETRTSAPLRILRNENMESINREGLYPIGEGAGYAGGIVSSAIDGVKAAYAIINKYGQPSSDFPDELWQILNKES